MGKVATESDVATAVCFLASDAASMITGTSIVIDGGWTANNEKIVAFFSNYIFYTLSCFRVSR